jgi:hypothetical protein
MKKITLITIIIAFASIHLNAQIDLENINYNRNLFQKIENKLYKHQKIIISDSTKKVILEKHRVNSLPFEYFIGLMAHLQNSNKNEKNDAFDKTKGLSIETFCECEPNRTLKGECSNFIEKLKKFTLKFRMIEAFKKKQKTKYLQLYQEYKYDLETEYYKYQRRLFPERFGFCGQPEIDDVFWYKDTNRIVMNFIKVDYFIDKNKMNKAISNINRVMNNNIIHLKESNFIQELIAERIANYVIKNDIRKAFEKELKAKIDDFIKNGQLGRKGVIYKSRLKIFGISITLETLSEARKKPTPKQIKRFEQSLPIKTKKEIVKEFKSTLIYKVMTNKRFLKKYSSL